MAGEDRVALELLFLDGDALAVELTVIRDGTPLRHYGSPLAAARPTAGAGRERAAAPLLEGQPAAAPDAPTAITAGERRRDGATAVQQHADPCSANQAAPARGAVGSSVVAKPVQQQPDPCGSGVAAVAKEQEAQPAGATPSGSEAVARAEQPDALASVLGMLHRLLASSDAAAAAAEHRQQQQQSMQQPATDPPSQSATPAPSAGLQPVAPAAPPPPPAPVPMPAAAAALPGGVEKLLALELEVVQLQQSLQIVQLEYETRTVQLHSLKQRADDAEQRAQAAEERAASLAQQAQQVERQAADLRCQLGKAAARHQQENAQLAARVAAAASKQAATEEEATQLRQALAAARQEGAAEAEAARRVAAQAQAAQRAAAAAQAEAGELAAALRRENNQLRGQVASACDVLKAMGIPASKIFGQAALAAADVTGSMQSPPASPTEAGEAAAAAPPGASDQRRSQPPQVPRLQLSAISLQELQAQASPTPQLPPLVLPPLPPTMQGEQRAEPRAASQQPGDPFAHVMSAADGAAVLGSGRTGAAHPGGALGAPSPAGSVQQSCEVDLPLLSARRSVSPAQQELLATARQWQMSARAAAAEAAVEAAAEELIPAHYPPPLPSARGSARRPGPAGFASAAAAAAGAAGRGAARPGHPPRHGHTPRGQTPRPGSGPPGGTPGPRSKALLRPTYGQDQAFLEIRAAYNAVMSSDADRASKWARSVFSSASAVDTNPRRVEPMVQGLLQLFAENGLHIPLQKCGACTYKLGAAKLSVRLVSGRLMARAGAGQTLDVLEWLGRQPLPVAR